MKITNVNSISALMAINRPQRIKDIVGVLRRANRPMTDREISIALGSYDPNYVKPRITEELKKGEDSVIIKVGDVRDEKTGRTVRLLMVRTSNEVQGRMF